MKDEHKDVLDKLTISYRSNIYSKEHRLLLRDAADTIREMRARILMLEGLTKKEDMEVEK